MEIDIDETKRKIKVLEENIDNMMRVEGFSIVEYIEFKYQKLTLEHQIEQSEDVKAFMKQEILQCIDLKNKLLLEKRNHLNLVSVVTQALEKPLKAFIEKILEKIVESNSLLIKEIRHLKSSKVAFSDLTENHPDYKNLKEMLGIEFIDMKIDEILQTTEFRTEIVDKNKDFTFTEYFWDDKIEPIKFLNDTLKRIKVGNHRDLFDKTAFKFVDTREETNKIGFSLDRTCYQGIVDCFIAPFRNANFDVAIQARVFCEMKPRDEITSLETFLPKFLAQLIAANYVSKHPVLGVLTNLSNHFILAYISETKVEYENESTSTSKKRKKNSCSIEIFDTSKVTNRQSSMLQSLKPIDFVCLFISYWLCNCSTNELFDVDGLSTRKQDPYNCRYFASFSNSQVHLREICDKNSERDLDIFLEQLNK